MKKFSMIIVSLMFFILISPSTVTPGVRALTISGPIPIPGNLLIPGTGTTVVPTQPNLGTVSTAPPPVSLYSINQVNSGLTASDPLNNETKTQQQLQANPGYWTYGGDAPLENAPYAVYRDTQGLHVGVQAPSNGTWAGYYALTKHTTAMLFHARISTPVQTLPANNVYYENGMYVQNATNDVNYVDCSSDTASYGNAWTLFSATGDPFGANTFHMLWYDPSPDQPLTRDCTIITNGTNYLKAYIDGTLVYENNALDLQMSKDLMTFLEPQSSYNGTLLNGTFDD